MESPFHFQFQAKLKLCLQLETHTHIFLSTHECVVSRHKVSGTDFNLLLQLVCVGTGGAQAF